MHETDESPVRRRSLSSTSSFDSQLGGKRTISRSGLDNRECESETQKKYQSLPRVFPKSSRIQSIPDSPQTSFIALDFRDKLETAKHKLRNVEKPSRSAVSNSEYNFEEVDDVVATHPLSSRRSAERRQRGLLLDGRDSCPPPPKQLPKQDFPEIIIEPFFKSQDLDTKEDGHNYKEQKEVEEEHVYGQLWNCSSGKPRGRWSSQKKGSSPERSSSSATFTKRRASKIAQLLQRHENLSASKKSVDATKTNPKTFPKPTKTSELRRDYVKKSST